MRTITQKLILLSLPMLLLAAPARVSMASDVDVQLSTRESYVGMPIVLQISVRNASDYEQPTIPEIAGCDIRSAGTPSQSSQLTIINGRRSESRTVTMQYLITPRKEGTFELPSFTINVDGRDQETQPLRFVATKSETGDLLFVEIEGGKERVFVGEPLDLTLKIWVKPFQDREKRIRLSEANMWQMISEQTSWGSFTERMKELAENNQRPGGREVIRDNGQGSERGYFLYEIKATVYPKRPGQINAEDVQIVVNYPTEIGKARDPFGDFFKDSPFGNSSRLSRMMGDDMFGSPFGNRLAVSKVRPIVAGAEVDSTEVVPVPTEGRPADYRGAVGRYNIVTQATPTSVSAGDPITLNIGITGTGPMELVQAPPLSTLSSLTTDFKVADQSLAGFVQEDAKVFSTTIRPRREGITQIPPISFSFFDPESESFQTVLSAPISITVDKSEQLLLDAIVGRSAANDEKTDASSSSNNKGLEPNFVNNDSVQVLISQSPAKITQWFWAFVIVPPVIWIVAMVFRLRNTFWQWLPRVRSARVTCFASIDRARTRKEINEVLVRFIARRTRSECSTDTTAVGALRTLGLNELGSEVESFFDTTGSNAFKGAGEGLDLETKAEARDLTERLDQEISSLSKSRVRSRKRKQVELGQSANSVQIRSASRNTMILTFALLAFSATDLSAFTEDRSGVESANKFVSSDEQLHLSESQQRTILQEAAFAYSSAMEVAETDSAEASDLFTTAATKYQILVDSGIQNSDLFSNLGNAYLQCNRLGYAIANFERAKRLEPRNRQLAANLKLANSLVEGGNGTGTEFAGSETESSFGQSIQSFVGPANAFVINLVGFQFMIWMTVFASLLFWGILIARASGIKFGDWRLSIVPLLVLIFALSSVLLYSNIDDRWNAVIVAETMTMHSGDGDQFEEVASVEAAQGHRVQVLNHRGDWAQIRTAEGHVGWVKRQDFETVIQDS